jgi:predicted RNase H-like nuclease (RuvC/YqgF family)
MEWGTITTLVAEVLFGGGLLAFVTIKDKKTAAILENMQKVIEEERGLAMEYRNEVGSLKEEIKRKDDTIRENEAYIRTLHRENSEIHDKLDKANSRAAVNKLLKCQEIGCGKRRPPLGEGAADTFKQIREGNLGDEDNGNIE